MIKREKERKYTADENEIPGKKRIKQYEFNKRPRVNSHYGRRGSLWDGNKENKFKGTKSVCANVSSIPKSAEREIKKFLMQNRDPKSRNKNKRLARNSDA